MNDNQFTEGNRIKNKIKVLEQELKTYKNNEEIFSKSGIKNLVDKNNSKWKQISTYNGQLAFTFQDLETFNDYLIEKIELEIIKLNVEFEKL